MKILILNGPNLNLLGRREPSVYGNRSFDEYFQVLQKRYAKHDLEYFQSNSEGEIISKIHQVGFDYDGIVLNAGAYTHTSIAIADAIRAVQTPVVELHISNAEELRAGGDNLAVIAEKLNRMEVKTPRGKAWTVQTVGRMLQKKKN